MSKAMDPIRTENMHPANPLGDLVDAVNGASDQQPTDSTMDEPLRRRRKRRKHRSSSSSSSSRRRSSSYSLRWRLSQEASAWFAIVAAIIILGGGTYWVYQLFTENTDLRSRLARETQYNRERLSRLETITKSTKMQEFLSVELDSEKFNTAVPFGPTPVQRPKDGALLVVNLRIPPGVDAERWEVTLRDQLQNAKDKVVVSQPRDNRISLALGNLSLDRYELHAKARGKDATFRYMFSLR